MKLRLLRLSSWHKSIPMVGWLLSSNSSEAKRLSKELLPTPEFPSNKICSRSNSEWCLQKQAEARAAPPLQHLEQVIEGLLRSDTSGHTVLVGQRNTKQIWVLQVRTCDARCLGAVPKTNFPVSLPSARGTISGVSLVPASFCRATNAKQFSWSS